MTATATSHPVLYDSRIAIRANFSVGRSSATAANFMITTIYGRHGKGKFESMNEGVWYKLRLSSFGCAIAAYFYLRIWASFGMT